jgi:hypothetical protein
LLPIKIPPAIRLNIHQTAGYHILIERRTQFM